MAAGGVGTSNGGHSCASEPPFRSNVRSSRSRGRTQMAPRPSWKGYLKLSLVSCPVALFPATTTRQRIRFNVINRETGHRVHNEIVDAETGKPVEEEDRVKGYREKGGDYVLVEEEELDRVAL